MNDLMKTASLLCAMDGCSGFEGEVRQTIRSLVSDYAETVITDPLGSLLVFVRGEKHIPGVIGCKAIQLCSASEKLRAPGMTEIYVDIGARDREDALRHVNIGDRLAMFAGAMWRRWRKAESLGECSIDRFGSPFCAVLCVSFAAVRPGRALCGCSTRPSRKHPGRWPCTTCSVRGRMP